MKTFVQPGELVYLTMPYQRNSGEGVLVGDLFGVVEETTANGAKGPVRTEGVFTLPKATGALAEGVLVYWDNAAKNVTATATGNRRIGATMASALSGDATVNVRLNGQAVPTGA